MLLFARINVYLAYLLFNIGGKKKDVHGRRYRHVYRRFGNYAMALDFKNGNSWNVKKRVGLI